MTEHVVIVLIKVLPNTDSLNLVKPISVTVIYPKITLSIISIQIRIQIEYSLGTKTNSWPSFEFYSVQNQALYGYHRSPAHAKAAGCAGCAGWLLGGFIWASLGPFGPWAHLTIFQIGPIEQSFRSRPIEPSLRTRPI